MLFFAVSSCRAQVSLTITNASKEDFKSLKVNIRGHEYEFKDLPAGANVKIKVDNTYHYFYAKALTSKDTLVLQPIDFVGEKLITSGKFEVKLDIKTVDNKRILNISNAFSNEK